MQREFLRLLKAYGNNEADLRKELAGKTKRHDKESAVWEKEFNRLLKEYESSGRNIDRLEKKVLLLHQFHDILPGSSIGLHTHEGNSEMIYILSGTGKVLCDGEYEPLAAGDCHYCPMGHSHAMFNDGDEDLVYFAIVPTHPQ